MKYLKLFYAKRSILFFVLTAATVIFVPDVLAGTGGSEFDDIYNLLVGWTQGTLGKVIALGVFMVGLGAAVITQTMGAVVIGICCSLALYYGPTVISGVVAALI
jgi:conjugal transfer pilus assembly protein TraA